MKENNQDHRKIPAVGRLIETSVFQGLVALYGHAPVVEALRTILDRSRKGAVLGQAADWSPDTLARRAGEILAPPLRRVINATGVLIHTHLGRSPLPEGAFGELSTWSSLEIDLVDGSRGHRNRLAADPLKRLTGAEEALVVNNNAAAIHLLLKRWCAGREVIVSRGELVEIGGSFRIPDILTESGAVLREVGTTNRTHLHDYADAVTEETAAILVTHPSNFRVVGFTTSPPLTDLVALARERGIYLFVDQGCGALVDLSDYGIRDEPTVRALIEAGADVVTFSGDKLLGGPQAGIAVGKREIIEGMLTHPLYRVLRPGKTVFTYLKVILGFFERGEIERIPLYAMAGATLETLRERAEKIVSTVTHPGLALSIVDHEGRFGGGTTPLETFPSIAVAVEERAGRDEALFTHLWRRDPPILSARREGRILIDLRTLFAGEEAAVAGALNAYSGQDGAQARGKD